MYINSVQDTNFTSKVKLADDFYQKPEQKLARDEVETLYEAINKLEKNKIDDKVDIFILDGAEAPLIGLRVRKKIKKQTYEGKSIISLFFRQLTQNDIFFAYSDAAERAKTAQTPVVKGRLDEFI